MVSRYIRDDENAMLAIDPGPVKSGWVLYHPKKRRVLDGGKSDNLQVADLVSSIYRYSPCAIEEPVFQGQGRAFKHILPTCFAVGLFAERKRRTGVKALLLPRKFVLLHFFGVKSGPQTKDADSRIREILAGSCNLPKNGLVADSWQALALAVALSHNPIVAAEARPWPVTCETVGESEGEQDDTDGDDDGDTE